MIPSWKILIRGCSNLNFIRSYRGNRRSENVGVRNRLEIFRKENAEVQKLKIEDNDLEEIESDFMNSKELHSQFKREVNKMNWRIELSNTERKYFEKKKLPNMLTWAEKEQIRQLYESDPDIWTHDKLSQCFPATPFVIKKILKSQMKMDEMEKIEAHDKAVALNWKRFKNGLLDVEISLKEHLHKFLSRDDVKMAPVDKTVLNQKEAIPLETKQGEFAQLISSCSKSTDNTESVKKNVNNTDSRLLGMGTKFSRVKLTDKPTTLDQLRHELSSSEGVTKYGIASDKHFLQSYKPNEQLNFKREVLLEDNVEMQKYSASEVDDQSPVSPAGIKLESSDKIVTRIKIPKKLRGKSSLFKKDDCFYDSQGHFLYRVPGMSS